MITHIKKFTLTWKTNLFIKLKPSLNCETEKQEEGIQVYKRAVFPSSNGVVGILVTSVVQSLPEGWYLQWNDEFRQKESHLHNIFLTDFPRDEYVQIFHCSYNVWIKTLFWIIIVYFQKNKVVYPSYLKKFISLNPSTPLLQRDEAVKKMHVD